MKQQDTTPARATWPGRGRAGRLAAALAAAAALSGCAPPPPGAGDPETHRGATVIAPGGTPGVNGPYNLPGLAPVGAHNL